MTDLAAISAQLASIDDLKSLLDGLFAHAPVGIAVIDLEGRIQLANQAYQELFGSLPPPEYSLFEDELAAELGLLDLLHAAMQGQIIQTPVIWYDPRELRHVHVEQGKRSAISMKTFPVYDAQGAVQYLIATYRDHTDEVLARESEAAEHERLQALEAQLRQAQKIEAIGRLAGSVAHDFNNLLTVINGYAELLLAKQPLGEDAEALQQIYQAGQQASALTNQLLAFGRRSILQPIQLNLNGVVNKLEKMLRRLLPEDIELDIRLAAELGQVMIDPSQLEQVVMNLVLNARDAMPAGGLLLLETANLELDTVYDQTHAEVEAGAYVMLAVSDNGVGMDEVTRQQVFEPFFTTKPDDQGTGLGLSTVYGIVRQSGGHIFVYSEPGHGSSFKIFFPRVQAMAMVDAPALPQASLPDGSETLLLVEDVKEVREFARLVLESCGYRVLTADNSESAQEHFLRYEGACRLLITDVILPRQSGPQLAKALQTQSPELRVLYISGYTDDAVLRYGILSTGIPFLAKPFSPSQLAQKVREVLDAAVEATA
ncbi:MAG: hybrid sensor histidine kinase/response regulator [Candidatus Melainabacteria bacterium HGW-Melainabacteria-1]|nr:MAG: hybrid sensor histidine kinase/response regulator [Candidatus Melainabacteria bacterium HGW-Melainabacteria-1]